MASSNAVRAFAVVAADAHLDEFVLQEREVDFVLHGGRQAVVADDDDRVEMVRAGAQFAALGGSERFHAGSVRDLPARPGGAPLASAGSAAPALCLPVERSGRRAMPLNPAKKKHKFVKAWMHEHVNDPYVQEAQRRGYRSRAAFKLLELAERDELLRPGLTVVDLGAAPGSWSQVLRERVGAKGRIVAIDVLPMDGIAGVTFVQGDFREDEGLAAVEVALAGSPVDLVVSDMAPNLSGIDPVDQARSIHLGELALEFAISHLREGGDLLVKVFQGSGLPEFQRAVGRAFRQGLRAQAEVVARSQPGDVPGRARRFTAEMHGHRNRFRRNCSGFEGVGLKPASNLLS